MQNEKEILSLDNLYDYGMSVEYLGLEINKVLSLLKCCSEIYPHYPDKDYTEEEYNTYKEYSNRLYNILNVSIEYLEKQEKEAENIADMLIGLDYKLGLEKTSSNLVYEFSSEPS